MIILKSNTVEVRIKKDGEFNQVGQKLVGVIGRNLVFHHEDIEALIAFNKKYSLPGFAYFTIKNGKVYNLIGNELVETNITEGGLFTTKPVILTILDDKKQEEVKNVEVSDSVEPVVEASVEEPVKEETKKRGRRKNV